MRKHELLGLAMFVTGTFSACNSGSSPRAPAADGGKSGTYALDASASVKPDASHLNAPTDAPYDDWTWLAFPDSKCASGKPGGIAINPHAGSKTLVLYFEGGGECYDASTCWGDKPTDLNLNGYNSEIFSDAAQRKYPIFDRGLLENPLRESNMVFIPYCTGDLHSGTTERDLQVDGNPKPTYFWGAKNLELYLADLVARFAGTKQVWMIGTSAGGYGTVLNFDRVVNAFHAPTNVIDDSGPPIMAKGATTNPLLKVWGYVAPEGCDTCTSYPNILHHDRALQPQSRYGFLSFAQDTVISSRLGYKLTEYPAVMDAFSNSLKDDANAATYIVTNEAAHVVESDLTLAPKYMLWLDVMASGDASWKDTTYAKP